MNFPKELYIFNVSRRSVLHFESCWYPNFPRYLCKYFSNVFIFMDLAVFVNFKSWICHRENMSFSNGI